MLGVTTASNQNAAQPIDKEYLKTMALLAHKQQAERCQVVLKFVYAI
jgi:hypothetical protein